MRVEDLRRAGFDKDAITLRVRQGRLQRLFRGVDLVGPGDPDVRGARLAAAWALGPFARVDRRDGAALHGLRRAGHRGIDVTVAARRLPPTKGVNARLQTAGWHPDDLAEIDGIPTVSWARALVSLGDVVPGPQVRAAWIQAERLRLLDVPPLEAVLGRRPRARGSAIVRELLHSHDPRWTDTRSELEILFLDQIAARGLAEPEVNAWVCGGRYMVDFLWRPHRLAVEAMSREWHSNPTARRDDRRRTHSLRRAGLTVAYLWWEDVLGWTPKAERVLRALG